MSATEIDIMVTDAKSVVPNAKIATLAALDKICAT